VHLAQCQFLVACRQAALDAALQQAGGTVPADVQAIVLRTPASSDDAARKHWGGSNPPYLTAHAMAWLRGHGAQHIVVDLPSVDKEDDGGYLVAHRTFWGIAKRGSRLVAAAGGGDPASDDSCPTWTAAQESKHGIPLATQADDDSDVWDSPAGSAMARHIVCRTITELAMVPPDLHDGEYMLVLAVAPIHMDAAPSDPLLVPYMK